MPDAYDPKSKASHPFEGPAPFSLKHKLLRIVWQATWLIFAVWTPPQLRAWRVFLLRLFGAKIGNQADVRGSAHVWYPPNLVMGDHTILAEGVRCYNMARITIHAQTIISQRCFLCAGDHDFRLPNMPLVTKPIEIGPGAWVAAEAMIGPGATVAKNCIVGARSVVFGTLQSGGIYIGNPARKVGSREGNSTDVQP
ncbi:MAG: putative colanic acid biosynthesis acetyltransferase WcaF [Halocynthiibacter sp.]|jgi:putative colanic acid biosynthesis acetyltransferase WcaF